MPEVHITADALIALRATSPLAARWGVAAPYDTLFATPAGRRLADLALSVDPVYEAFNLARFRWFSERFADAAAAGRQIVLLGAGFDTRGDALAAAGADVFEVDFPEKLAEKAAVLSAAGVARSPRLHSVGTDLAGPVGDRLAAAGLDRIRPTAVFLEGVSFFLAADVLARLIDNSALGLAASTRLAFDAWTHGRIALMAERVEVATGRRLFGDAGFTEAAAAALPGHTTLANLCARYGAPVENEPLPGSWFVAEATLG